MGYIMIFNDTLIQDFLLDLPLEASKESWIYDNIVPGKHMYAAPDPKRKDVALELTNRLSKIINRQDFFNKELLSALFPQRDMIWNSITIYAAIGIPKPYDAILRKDRDGNTIFIIDLHQIADYTREIDKMIFIIQNYLTQELTRICITHDFPSYYATTYKDILSYHTFCEGLIRFLGWGENFRNYQLSTEKYEEHRGKSFLMLQDAMKMHGLDKQKTVLKYLSDAGFWDEFSASAGMFLWELVAQDGLEIFIEEYKKGWKEFIPDLADTY